MALLLTLAICLCLCACGGTASAEPAAEMDVEEILLSEKWLTVTFNGDTNYQFVGGGIGYIRGDMLDLSMDWRIDGNYVVVSVVQFGNEMKYSFTMEEVDGIYRLQLNTGENYLVRESDFEEAMADAIAAGIVIEEAEIPKEIMYYEECTSLPTADSSVDVTYSGKGTSTSNGETTKIEYKYQADTASLKAYADYLSSNGFEVENNSETEYEIIKDKYVIAKVSFDGHLMIVNIVPENKREMSASNAVTIVPGQTIVTPNYEFTLNNVELTYELKPINTSSAYTSYPADAGKVYIHIDGYYYNTSKRDVCIRDLFVPTADYDNGYTYNGFAIVDDGDNSFDWVASYVICTPLETCHYHGLIECPEAVDASDKPLYVTFTLADGITYRYDIR